MAVKTGPARLPVSEHPTERTASRVLRSLTASSSGAASVGFQGRASEILDKSVLSQLDLAERYFQDTRLGEKGPVSLVDLYLTVLTPAARVEQRPHAALDIAGRQAKALHVSGDRSQPITRHSILSGLLSHAQQRLDALINGNVFEQDRMHVAVRTGTLLVFIPPATEGPTP